MTFSRFFALLLAFSTVCTAASASGPLRVKTATGKVEGTLTSDAKVRMFRGIPYAAPPVGDLRWRAPQAAAHWKGVRPATAFGSRCVQFNPSQDMNFHDPGPSEDCLTLNVWAPVDAKALPVMVWIYGGGYSSGGTSEGRQDGQFLAHRGVVVVSMNYRLGILGFLTSPQLTAESPQHASGNYGLLDQAAAIAWVRANIRQFGGDPNNITLFGESAGSFSVSAQMASPLSKGSLAKAIGESGGAFRGNGYAFLPRADRETADSAATLQIYGTSDVAALRKLSADEIVAPFTAHKTTARFTGCVDGYFLPESVEAIYAAGQQAHIPLIAGWNKDESRGVPKVPPTIASFTQTATTTFGNQAGKFLSVYGASTDAEAAVSAGDYAGDRFIAFSTWRWIEAQVATGGSPVYRYQFDLGSPGDKFHPAAAGAFHSDDIEYVFGTLDSRQEITVRDEDRRLSEEIGSYWTNFARTGNPNGAGLPQWPVYDAAGQYPVMHLDVQSAPRPDEQRARYLFLDQYYK